jgi:hypothetical protein
MAIASYGTGGGELYLILVVAATVRRSTGRSGYRQRSSLGVVVSAGRREHCPSAKKLGRMGGVGGGDGRGRPGAG